MFRAHMTKVRTDKCKSYQRLRASNITQCRKLLICLLYAKTAVKFSYLFTKLFYEGCSSLIRIHLYFSHLVTHLISGIVY